MGGRGLRPIAFGNGQNRKKGSSLRNRGPRHVVGLQREQMAKARNRLATNIFKMFSRCHEALTLVSVAELQAHNCTSQISI